jgi:EmrB/QacA subfamily drug resistance transporter
MANTKKIVAKEVEHEDPHYKLRWWILAVLAIGQLMVILDNTVVNIALPTAQKALHFSNADRQWIVTAYSLSFGSLLLLGGRIGDMLGRKKALLIGLIGFAIASAVGGSSVNFAMLVSARAVQGAFAAILTPVVLALLATTFTTPKERDKAFGIYGAIAGGGAGIGLLLGGVLTTYASWRWTLFVNLFFAAVAVTGSLLWLTNDKSSDRDPLDIKGLFFATLGLFSIVYGLSHANTTSWTNPLTLIFLIGGVVLIGIFTYIERIAKYPLLPLRVLLDRSRGASLLTSLFASIGIFGVFLFLTYYLQGILGWSAVKTGVGYLPMIFALVVMSVVTNNTLLPKLGPKIIVPIGLILCAIALFLLHTIGIHTNYLTHIMPYLIVLGFGFGLSLAPSFNTGTLGLAPHDAGVGSAVLNTAQQIGGSIGTALLNTLAASAASAYLVGKIVTPLIRQKSIVHSYSVAFLWSAGIFLFGALIAAIVFKSGNLAKLTKEANEKLAATA